MNALHERCKRDAEAARTKEEFDEVDERCKRDFANANAQGDDTVVANGDLEVVSRAELEAWWPYRPILIAPPSLARDPVFAAVGPAGGRASDPRTDAASAEVYYAGAATIYEADLPRFYRAGGVMIGVQSPQGFGPLPHQGTTQPVQVRGQVGELHRIELEDGFHARMITWRASVAGADEPATFAVVDDADSGSDEQAIAFVNSLVELR
jgi:hypothetical protein